MSTWYIWKLIFFFGLYCCSRPKDFVGKYMYVRQFFDKSVGLGVSRRETAKQNEWNQILRKLEH